MKNSDIRNLRVLAASLCLSTTLLTGCSEKEYYGTSKIDYESEIPTGTISYEDLNNCGKIVTVESNEITSQLFVMKEKNYHSSRYGSSYYVTSYTDLKTGTAIIEYKDISDEKIWVVGENLTIVEEQDITSYLLQENFIKKEYEVSEVLTFFEETIKPILNGNEKEMVK